MQKCDKSNYAIIIMAYTASIYGPLAPEYLPAVRYVRIRMSESALASESDQPGQPFLNETPRKPIVQAQASWLRRL